MKGRNYHTIFRTSHTTLLKIEHWLDLSFGPEGGRWQIKDDYPRVDIAAIEFEDEKQKLLFDLKWGNDKRVRIMPSLGQGPSPCPVPGSLSARAVAEGIFNP